MSRPRLNMAMSSHMCIRAAFILRHAAAASHGKLYRFSASSLENGLTLSISRNELLESFNLEKNELNFVLKNFSKIDYCISSNFIVYFTQFYS